MVHALPTWVYATDAHFLKLQRLRTELSALLAAVTSAHWSVKCMWLSEFLKCVVV
jgi:hypothetical protein